MTICGAVKPYNPCNQLIKYAPIPVIRGDIFSHADYAEPKVAVRTCEGKAIRRGHAEYLNK